MASSRYAETSSRYAERSGRHAEEAPGTGSGFPALTTHYMVEAERLCDRVAIVDHGRVLPLTAFIEALRGVMNEGHGLAQIAPQVAILAAWGIAGFVIALRIFRWK